MPKYRKKPVEIEAIQWHEGTMMMHDVLEHFGGLNGMGANSISRPAGKLLIETLEGTMTVSDGDWIIRGVKGELYPCKPDIFEKTYEPADPTPVQPDSDIDPHNLSESITVKERMTWSEYERRYGSVGGGNKR